MIQTTSPSKQLDAEGQFLYHEYKVIPFACGRLDSVTSMKLLLSPRNASLLVKKTLIPHLHICPVSRSSLFCPVHGTSFPQNRVPNWACHLDLTCSTACTSLLHNGKTKVSSDSCELHSVDQAKMEKWKEPLSFVHTQLISILLPSKLHQSFSSSFELRSPTNSYRAIKFDISQLIYL